MTNSGVQIALRGSLMALVVGLGACGGGGEGDASTTDTLATQAFPAKTALENAQTTARTVTVSGTRSDGVLVSWTMSNALSSAASAHFPLATRATAQSIVIRAAGAAAVTTNAVSYSIASSLTPLGIDYPDGSCMQITYSTPVAATGKVGDVIASSDGSLYSTCRSSGSLAGYISTVTTIERDGNIAFVCGTASSKDTSRAVVATVTTCSEIDTSGVIGAKARITVAANGLTLTAKNY